MATVRERAGKACRISGLAALVGAILHGGPAAADPVSMNRVPGPLVACNFEGWSNDPDPAGLPIRANPDPQAPSIGRLPPPKVIGVDEVAPTVTVDGYRDGWFRISGAELPYEAVGNRTYTVWKGSGWVPAPMIKAALASDVLLTAPRANAPRKAVLRGKRPDGMGGSFPLTPDMVAVKRLTGCKDNWVEAETEFGLGWASRVCGRQLAGCP